MYCRVLDPASHNSPESPVPSSNAPGTAPRRTAVAPCVAIHSQSAPVSRGTKDEKDHHCEVMDSRTALSSRLLCSRCRSSINRPFPVPGGFDRSILDLDAPCGDDGHLSICSRAESVGSLLVLDSLDDALAGRGAGREEAGEDAYEEA